MMTSDPALDGTGSLEKWKLLMMITGEDALIARPHSKVNPSEGHPRKKMV